MNNLKIEVFYLEEGKNNAKLLPLTSKYLEERQLIPNVGDAVTLSGNDGVEVLGLKTTATEHIMTVRRVWYNYSSCDVAIFVHYVAF